MKKHDTEDAEFQRRREEMRARINPLDKKYQADSPDRSAFFDAIYDTAEGDPAGVPWADLKPKEKLAEWLASNPGKSRNAIDIACGLGDNAEALAEAGYTTTAFDFSAKAIEWARERFPGSSVDYRVANLLEPPEDWIGNFDLVNECYTIQSMPLPLHGRVSAAVANLVKPGGLLLVYTRTRPQDSDVDGPPFPLMPSESGIFAEMGFETLSDDAFDIVRPDRTIPHLFTVWRKN
jgi:2-polyprenyl-3-methyl-5-hydroxy-6-metoxy-1,4-benzoquinol methylase